jgi:hypothetical protein
MKIAQSAALAATLGAVVGTSGQPVGAAPSDPLVIFDGPPSEVCVAEAVSPSEVVSPLTCFPTFPEAVESLGYEDVPVDATVETFDFRTAARRSTGFAMTTMGAVADDGTDAGVPWRGLLLVDDDQACSNKEWVLGGSWNNEVTHAQAAWCTEFKYLDQADCEGDNTIRSPPQPPHWISMISGGWGNRISCVAPLG